MTCNTNRCGCAYASMIDEEPMPMPPVVCANVDVMVPAGEAHTRPCDDFGVRQVRLAEIQFPIQQYESGFCPCEALESGTLFPELIG